MESITSKIQTYMNSEAVCLEDWYGDYRALAEIPGEPVTIKPNLNEIKKAFAAWVELRREQLFNLICVEWDYPARRKNEKLQDKMSLAAALADFLLSCALQIPAPVATSVLLVQMGLDQFCHS
ncbi:MAG: hypothetical protein QOH25_2512 [Acidobacteriota bacterium]|jgi:hypothetical protein|nr:hypothetical protein [Acidobacteriota bacterium]